MPRFVLPAFFLIAITSFALPALSAPESDLTHTAPGLGRYDVPFFPDGTYRSEVKSPEQILGYPIGSKPAPHPDIIGYFHYLADNFDNVELHEYARSYEGRELVYLIITSEENANKIDAIRADINRLADPRQLRGESDVRRIVHDTPAVAWLAYGIHGDELSSCDAAMQVAYQLVAGTDEATKRIRDSVVTIIDPMENPDGRTRWLGQIAQWNSVVPSTDIQSLHHRGVWPYGRGNHYFFDLNRDWFALVHPETRGKTAAMLEWMPQYVLDCHEMGATDTYLFSPPREPFNPNMPEYIHKWWKRVADDHASAFDQYGWSYYTREWNEEFFPGYGSSWSIYLGAIGMLFEQAGVDGSQVKRYEGTVMTYRETVHHQFIGSMSNLETVAGGREELLDDYYKTKVANLRSKPAVYVFAPSSNLSRMDRFVERLQHQHIEVEQAIEAFTLARARNTLGKRVRDVRVPAGSVIVRTNQPLRQLVDVILAFDIRIPNSFLATEKKEILKNDDSRLYDTTGWSLPLAYGLDGWYSDAPAPVRAGAYTSSLGAGGVSRIDSPVGFVFDGTDDGALVVLARLMERGTRVRCARKPFANAGREYPRGSFQIRRGDNPDLDTDELSALALENHVQIEGISGPAGASPYVDLGGNEFALLTPPRVAVVGGSPVSAANFGAVWHLLDARMNLRTTTLDISTVAGMDLATYNVLILPDNSDGPDNYRRQFGDAGIHKLKDWVGDGGTLIAEGRAAAFLADTSVAISGVRVRRQVLKDTDDYKKALAAAKAADSPVIDSLALWEGTTAVADTSTKNPPNIDALRAADEKARRLYAHGAILRVNLDADHWMTSGCGKTVPVMFNSDYAYLAPAGLQVPGRLAAPADVRLSGLLWEEARARWSETAYATREPSGKGQVILFAALPDFRGYFFGAERLLLNAVLLGPGLGTAPSLEW